MAHQIGAEAIPVQRIQRNLLAASERKLLNWLCARMPRWVTPDRLTATGVAGAVATFVGYAASGAGAAWLWLAIVGFAIQWFGDSMNGSLARYRRIERPAIGYFIDHSCDGLTVFLILAGMGLSPYLRLDVALIALVGYLLLCIHAFLTTKVIGEMKLSYLSAGPTELRLILIGLTAAMLVLGPSAGAFGRISGFDLFVGGVGALLIALFMIQTLITARSLATLDTGNSPS